MAFNYATVSVMSLRNANDESYPLADSARQAAWT